MYLDPMFIHFYKNGNCKQILRLRLAGRDCTGISGYSFCKSLLQYFGSGRNFNGLASSITAIIRHNQRDFRNQQCRMLHRQRTCHQYFGKMRFFPVVPVFSDAESTESPSLDFFDSTSTSNVLRRIIGSRATTIAGRLRIHHIIHADGVLVVHQAGRSTVGSVLLIGRNPPARVPLCVGP
ncbi:MAG: hypothetical protein R2683_01685 [Bifidobacterium adolescentis]